MKSKPLSLLAGAMLALSLATIAPTNAWADEPAAETTVIEEAATDESAATPVEGETGVVEEDQGEVTDGDVVTPEPVDVVVDDQDQAAPVEGDGTVIDDATAVEDEDATQTEGDAEDATDEEEQAPEEAESKDEDEVTSQGNDPDAQKALDELAAEHAKDLPEGRYEFVSNAKPATDGDTTTYVLDVKGGKKGTATNPAEAILYSEQVTDSQYWDISYGSGGYAFIKNVKTGQYLSLMGGDNAYDEGTAKVVLWDHKKGALWQKWIIIKQGDGTFKLVSGLLKNGTDMRVLDVRGGKAKSGATTIVYSDKTSNDANQRWTIRVTNAILDAEAQEHRDDLPDGTYIIGSSVNSSLVLNVRRNSKNDGGEIILYPDDTVTVNDGWTIVHNEAGYITIMSSSSGKVLDVRGGKAKSGATVFQWTDKQTGARNQAWIATLEADGSYTFTSALAGNVRYVLSVASVKDGAATLLQPDKAGSKDNQHWVLSQAPEQYAYAHVIADGTYLIRTSLDMTKVLDVARNSKDSGAQVKLWTCKLSDNQLWIVSHDNQGYVRFQNKNSGLYLAFSSKAVDGNIITVQTTKVTRWVVETTDEGPLVIRDPKTGRCIDLRRSSTSNGAKVIAYKATDGKNQQWYIAPPAKIALDPGHGGNDSGAVGNGLRECDLTWSITQSCAETLRTYGFEVFITIKENEFKNGSTVSIQERVNRAANAGCIAIFSMHINAGGGTGAVALVPNSSSYHEEYYNMGQSFAKNLMSKFNSVGISTWGDGAWERDFKVSEGATEAQYYDGKGGLSGSKTSYGYADYYGIVRYARLRGMFGVIIEHGFIDNAHDAAILGTASGRKALAKADAQAIKALYV